MALLSIPPELLLLNPGRQNTRVLLWAEPTLLAGQKASFKSRLTWAWQQKGQRGACDTAVGTGGQGQAWKAVQGSAGESLSRTWQLMPEYELYIEIKIAWDLSSPQVAKRSNFGLFALKIFFVQQVLYISFSCPEEGLWFITVHKLQQKTRIFTHTGLWCPGVHWGFLHDRNMPLTTHSQGKDTASVLWLLSWICQSYSIESSIEKYK